MADSREAPQDDEEALRAALAAHLGAETMDRLRQVMAHSGLSIREILAQAIDVAWDVALSGELMPPAGLADDDIGAADAENDSCRLNESLIALSMPVPPSLAEALGYDGAARYVAFYWEPVGDELMFDDGRRAGTGEWYAFQQWREHPTVAAHVQDMNLGYSDLEATHWLIIDREHDLAYIAHVSTAQAFLNGQHPPPRAIPQEELHELQAAVAAALQHAVKDVRIDRDQIERDARIRQQAIEEMLTYLDNLPHEPIVPPHGV